MIVRRNLSQEVSDSILEMIRDGSLQTGQKLPTEAELVAMFNVSRTAVREAIKSLTALNVLKTRQGIGTFVEDAEPGALRQLGSSLDSASSSILQDLLEFRLIVEPETAALAARLRTLADVAELRRCVDELERWVSDGKPGKPTEDLGFHLALARASRNTALIDTSSLIARFYQRDQHAPNAQDVVDHRAIFEAVRDRDTARARNAMREHLIRQRDE